MHAPDGRTHGNEGKLKAGNRLFEIEIRDQIDGTLQVGAENGEVVAFAGDAPMRLRCRRTQPHDSAIGDRRQQEGQNRSPVSRIERQTWQAT